MTKAKRQEGRRQRYVAVLSRAAAASAGKPGRAIRLARLAVRRQPLQPGFSKPHARETSSSS